MKKCPVCREEFPEAATFCKKDNKALVKVAGRPRSMPEPPSSFNDPEYERGTNSKGNADMVLGAIFCIGGIVVTVISYSGSRSGGGHYVVAWGAILFGAIRFFRGVASK